MAQRADAFSGRRDSRLKRCENGKDAARPGRPGFGGDKHRRRRLNLERLARLLPVEQPIQVALGAANIKGGTVPARFLLKRYRSEPHDHPRDKKGFRIRRGKSIRRISLKTFTGARADFDDVRAGAREGDGQWGPATYPGERQVPFGLLPDGSAGQILSAAAGPGRSSPPK